MKRCELIRAAIILAANRGSDDDSLAGRLVAEGFEEGSAYRLVAFLPSAFARPLLEHLGASGFEDRAIVHRSSSES